MGRSLTVPQGPPPPHALSKETRWVAPAFHLSSTGNLLSDVGSQFPSLKGNPGVVENSQLGQKPARSMAGGRVGGRRLTGASPTGLVTPSLPPPPAPFANFRQKVPVTPRPPGRCPQGTPTHLPKEQGWFHFQACLSFSKAQASSGFSDEFPGSNSYFKWEFPQFLVSLLDWAT